MEIKKLVVLKKAAAAEVTAECRRGAAANAICNCFFICLYNFFFFIALTLIVYRSYTYFLQAAKNSRAAKSWARILSLLAFCTRCNGSTSQKCSTSGSRHMSTRTRVLLPRSQTPWDLRPAVTGASAFEVRALGCCLFFLYLSPSATPLPPPIIHLQFAETFQGSVSNWQLCALFRASGAAR